MTDVDVMPFVMPTKGKHSFDFMNITRTTIYTGQTVIA